MKHKQKSVENSGKVFVFPEKGNNVTSIASFPAFTMNIMAGALAAFL